MKKRNVLKKSMALLLALAFLVGCGSGTTNDAGTETATTESTEATDTGESASEAEEISWPSPDDEFTIMVGYAPGGGNHSMALIAQKYFEKYLGCTVTIQNVPGAAGLLGFNQLYQMESGYGVQMSSTNNGTWTLPFLSPTDVPWTVDDWKTTGIWSNLLTAGMVCKSDAEWNDFADLIEDAQNRPDEEIVVASIGPGRSEDLIMIEIMEYFDVKFKWVFYDSSSTIQTDILTGDIDVGVLGCGTEQFVDNPEYRVLTCFLPDFDDDYELKDEFPTMQDFEERLGFKCEDLPALYIGDYTSWVVKSDTPDYIYDKICEAVKQMCEDPEYQEEISTFKVPIYISPEEAEPIYEEVTEIIESYVPLHEQYVER